jgi:hypothetical protein
MLRDATIGSVTSIRRGFKRMMVRVWRRVRSAESGGGGAMFNLFARCCKMVFLYVSLWKREKRYDATKKKTSTHSTHCQSLREFIYAAMTGLTPVATKGPRENKVVMVDLWLGGKISAPVPDPTANTGPPNAPAKNRKMIIVQMFGAKPAPRVKSVKIGIDMRYTARLPSTSLAGEPIKGPNANPMT